MRKLITLGLVLVASIAMVGCVSPQQVKDPALANHAIAFGVGTVVAAAAILHYNDKQQRMAWTIPGPTTAYQRASR